MNSKLIYTTGPDWFYKTNLDIADPHFLYVDTHGKSHAMVGPLEYDIARAKNTIDHLYHHEELSAKLPEGEKPTTLNFIRHLITADGNPTVEVAEDFPAFLFTALQEADTKLHVAKGFIFPERMIKSKAEIDHLRAAQALNQEGFRRAEEILSAATIAPDTSLIWNDAPLTSEILQGEINQVFAKAGCNEFAGGPIVAGGSQGAIPHERGHGGIYAGHLLVIDSFPQSPTKYYGDLTRTYLKGNPTDWQKKVYNTVLGAQELALSLMKPEADLRDIQKQVVTYFKDHNFDTGQTQSGSYFGYIHGIGHHIGLKVHDGAQQRQESDLILKPGHVVTVEPGLYYPKGSLKDPKTYGGCRIEDVVAITEDGHENLTTLPKDNWIIA